MNSDATCIEIDINIVVDSLVCKIGCAMALRVVFYYAWGERNPKAATNIVEFQQQQ